MIKAVIFDLDDTLISEREYIKSGYHHIAGLLENQLSIDKKELYILLESLFEDSPKNVFNRLFESLGCSYTKEQIMNLVDEYRNHKPNIKFFADVEPCLRQLKKLTIKTGIITDGYANAQRQKLSAVHANDFFDEIIITDELGREYWKPHPKSFELMQRSLGVEFDEMIYVGDNPEKDFYISSIYPITTVRINRDGVYESRGYLEDIKEHYSLDGLVELRDLVL